MAISQLRPDSIDPRSTGPPDFLALTRQGEAGEVVEQRADDIRRSLSRVTTGDAEVVWLQGQSCSGCTMSLLQSEFPAIEGVLSEFREQIAFHTTLGMGEGGAGHGPGPAPTPDPDVLIVEGSVPVEIPRAATLGRDEHGERKPVVDWVIELGERADVVVAVGTCSAYGGLPAAGRHDSGDVGADPTGARGLQFDGREPGGVFGPAFRTGRGLPVVNVPGCPAHPEHVLLTLATLLNGHDPELDEFNRPLPIFGPLVHDDCELREEYENGNFADNPGEDGCLYEAGCAGVYSYCDDSLRLRNGGTTICRAVGAPCIGCVEPAFWDRFTPFYETGEDDGCGRYEGCTVGDSSEPARRPDMSAVGVVSGLLLSLVMLPLVPVLAVAAALSRWLGDDEPVRWGSHDRSQDHA
jgi:hydrogenase small subunit